MSRSIAVALSAVALCALAVPVHVVAGSTVSPSRSSIPKEAIVMFYGGTLHSPVTFFEEPPDWALMPAIFGDAQEGSLDELHGRTSIGVALFESGEWYNYPRTAESFAQLKPEQADQHGHFYPASGTSRALLQLDSPRGVQLPIVLSDTTLAYLEKRGVPVRVTGN